MEDRFKFRAWDKESKQMRTSFGVHNEMGLPYINNLEVQHNWILMQCTGLKDRTQKLIFEGDIVKILYTDWISKSYDDKRTLEQYLWDKACILQVEFIGSEYCLTDIEYGYQSSIHPGKHGFIQVLGNIYENENLLNEVKNDR